MPLQVPPTPPSYLATSNVLSSAGHGQTEQNPGEEEAGTGESGWGDDVDGHVKGRGKHKIYNGGSHRETRKQVGALAT